ncbi:hypothetical protein Tco_1396729 [Tanacetum coccineum]
MLKLMNIPGMFHLEGRLLESRGCLLLVYRDDIGSREFTIYKMMKGKVVKMIFSEDGFSIIASQICKPIMLDSYTSSMCIESWGGSNFACCLIEINVKDVLKKSLTIGVPLIEDTGFTIETVTIEYE